MKRQIRQGVFETNSSSTHALCVMNKEQSTQLDNGEVYIDSNLRIVTKEEVEKRWEEYRKEYNDYDNMDDYRKEWLCTFTMDEFEDWCDENYYETLWKTTPDGEWTAVSLWGDRT